MSDIVERARRVADDVLFPAALKTDASAEVPVASLDALAREGLYGIDGPVDAGGLALEDSDRWAVIEALASGCLSTTFVWIQHHSVVRAVAGSTTPGVRERWLGPLCRGEVRAGIARAGEIPGPPRLTAEALDEGIVIDGEAAWVSGWSRIDLLLVAARAGASIVRAFVSPQESASLSTRALHLVGANASDTRTVTFREHRVAASDVVESEPHADVLARDPSTLRANVWLALGVADRCCRLIGPGPLDDELALVRGALAEASTDEVPEVRARAAELALRAAAALTVADGGRAILPDHHAQRLAREALFLLVFGSRAAIRTALMERLTGPAGG